MQMRIGFNTLKSLLGDMHRGLLTEAIKRGTYHAQQGRPRSEGHRAVPARLSTILFVENRLALRLATRAERR